MKIMFNLKIAAVFVAIMMLFSGMSVFAADTPTMPGFDLSETTTSALIIDPRNSDVFILNTKTTSPSISVPVTCTNATTSIHDLYATVTNAADLPFELTTSCKIDRLDSWGSSLLFETKLTPLTKPGKYPINISCTYSMITTVYNAPVYDNESGQLISPASTSNQVTDNNTATLTYYVEVINTSYDTYMSGDAVSMSSTDYPESVASGDKFKLNATFANNFPFDIDNVVFKLENGDFIFDNDSNAKTVNLKKNGNATVSWSLVAPAITESGLSQLTLSATYKNDEGGEIVKSFYVAIHKYAPDSIDPLKPKADVTIDSFTAPESVKAGELFETQLTVTNKSETDASKVEIKVASDSTLKIASTNPDYPAIKAGESASFIFKFTVPTDTTDVFSNLTATVKVDGSEIERIATAGVVIEAAEAAVIKVESTKFSKENVGINTPLTLTVTLKNHSNETEAKNTAVIFTAPSGVNGRSANRVVVEKLGPGESVDVSYDMYVTDGVTTGTNYQSVAFTVGEVEYSAGTLVTNPEKDNGNPDDTEATKPTIIINSYDFGGENVKAGGDFTLTLEFLNTSATTAVKNMKITVDSGSDTGGVVFVPSSSSNTFFVENLGAKSTVTKTIDLNVRNDAEPKSSSINIEISSDNGKSATETITIPVRQEIRFNMNTPSDIGTISMEDEGYLSLGCSNMGKSTIYNVNIKISGEGFSLSEPEYFAGNMTPGQAVNHQFYITPMMSGDMSGEILYEYEDSTGEKFSQTQSFIFSVIEDYSVIWDEPVDPGMDEIPSDIPVDGEPIENEAISWIWYVVIGGVVIVAAIIVITVVVKKRRETNEEDDY